MIFYSYCFARLLLLHVQPLPHMSKSILAYFKPVGNRREHEVKLPDPTG